MKLFGKTNFLLSSITLLLLLFTKMASAVVIGSDIASFVGEWQLTEIYDSVDSSVPKELPKEGGPFVLKLSPSDKDPEHSLLAWTKVGNTMRTSIVVLDADQGSIKVGSLMSTQMMPPQELFDLEILLSKVLPAMDQMVLSNDGDELVMFGTGKMVLTSVETTES
jgi:hypothetical protein